MLRVLPGLEAEIAHAYMSNQPLIDQPLHAGHGRPRWKQRTRPLLLVEVDVIDAQSPRAAASPGFDHERQADRKQLGGDEHLIPPPANRLADDSFRAPEPVHLSRIDEVDAQLERSRDNCTGFPAGEFASIAPLGRSELPRPQPD